MKSFPIFYDFRVAPLSFDFAVFLAIGYGHARRLGYETVDVYLVRPFFRRSNQIESTYDGGYDEWKFNNVIVKLLSFTQVVKNFYVIKDDDFHVPAPRYPAEYHPLRVNLNSGFSQIPTNFVHLAPLFNQALKPFIFRSKDVTRAHLQKKYGGIDVSLTLRTAIQKPGRNINLADWYELYKLLIGRGLRVAVVPDHDDIYGGQLYKNYDWLFIEEAGADLEYRLATYEISGRNISWACGMYTLLFFSGANFLILGKYDESENTSSSNFLARKGPPLGSQFPWANPESQIIDWTERRSLDFNKLKEISLKYLGLK